jgi:hypothetical protein
VAHFLAAVEGKAEPRWGRQRTAPADALAAVSASAAGVLEARLREAPKAKFPVAANKGLGSEKGLLGFSREGFALAFGRAALPKGYTPIGAVMAATEGLDGLEPGRPLETLRIYRVGGRAKAFRAFGAAGSGGKKENAGK